LNGATVPSDTFYHRSAIVTRGGRYSDSFEGSLNFIALEYVPGRTLDQALQNEGPLEVERALGIAQQAAQCPTDASTVGIVH
jgi:hypothetical protein